MGLLSYERYLEESLDRGLSAYLGPERFIVQVKAVLGESPVASRMAGGAQAPGDPALPAMGMPPISRDADEPPVLPGLAFESERDVPAILPPLPSLSPQVPMAMPLMPSGPVLERKIDRLRVSVVLPSTLTSQDEDFIRNMVMQKVDHQLTRDLAIEISRRDFPAQPIAPSQSAALPPWLWIALAGAGGLALGLALMALRRAPQAATPASVPTSPGVLASNEPLRSSSESLRHELTMLLLSEPELAERYMSQLLAQELGMERAAVLTRTLGSGVSRRLFPGVSEELWRAIELKHFEKHDLPAEEVQQALTEAIRTIARERHAGGRMATRRQDPFAFLETLDDSQILFILQEESPRVQALVYSQLPPHRAIALMQLINPGELGAVTAAMGELSAIPLAAFHDIALHLAAKASDAPRFATAVTNGIDLLVGLLDHSDRQMEQRILQELSTQNPQVLKQVKESYLAFDDIPKLGREVLRDAVRDFPKEQLAEVLRDAPADVASVLKSALNDRGRQVVDEALKGPSLLDINPAAREAMRRDLLNRIRQTSRVLVVPQAGGK